MVKVTGNQKINSQGLPEQYMSVKQSPLNNGKINLPGQIPTTPVNPYDKGATGNASYIESQGKANAQQPTKYERNERTTGGFNYNLDKEVNQNTATNQQGQYNSLVGSGHVAGMSYWPGENPAGQNGNAGNKMVERSSIIGNINKPEVAAGTNTAPTNKVGGGGKKSPVQTGVSEQPAQQEERIITPDEFGTRDINKAQEEGQSKDEYNQSVMQNMANDLNQSTAGEIYGKVTADQNTAIQTLEDANSVYQSVNEARMQTLKTFLAQDPHDVAVSLAGGDNAYSDMTLRDAMQYAPEFYKQIQDEVKKIQAGETANAISTGTEGPSVTGTATSNTNNGVDTWAESISSSPRQTSDTIHNLTNAMANNQVATTATQEMLNINAQIAEYEEKLNNLEKEANKAFKGDVPQYVVSAYIANRRQKYQSEINKLESRYNSALDLYKTELSNAQWQEEMKLKYLQYQQGVNNDNWTRYYQSQVLKQNAIKWVDNKAYRVNDDGTITQLSDATAYMSYQNDVNSALQGYMSIYTSGGATKTGSGYKYNVSGGQCETFTDNFTEATTGLRMTGAGGRGWTTAEEKIGYINSFVPEVGSVAVAVGGAYNSKYGHTMLVTGYDPSTGIVDLLWSNKDGDEMVYSTTAKLSDLQARGLKGFWNPYKDLIAQSGGTGNYAYSGFNTPMAGAFERIAADSSLSATQRNALPIALEMYDTLYEIANNGQLDALVGSGDLALIMNDFKNKKFSNADRGEKFLDTFSKALTNKMSRLAGGDDSYNALMALQRIIEAKLRDESGAAISSSEWATNFSYLLPQAGESNYVKQQKLKAWDRIISTKFITAGGRMSEYVPIFEDATVREIRGY